MIYLKLIYYSIGKRDVTIKKCNCFYLKRKKGTWYNGYQQDSDGKTSEHWIGRMWNRLQNNSERKDLPWILF
mgnify:FL=1